MHTREIHFTLPLLHEVFAGLLMFQIGLELMKTIVIYMDEFVIHVEGVLSACMIATARHAMNVDFNNVLPLAMIGIGARNHCRIDDWVLLCQKGRLTRPTMRP